MAPRNLTQTVVENSNQEDCSDLALGKCNYALLHWKKQITEFFLFLGKSLTDFNWQKAMIQSRIMEKVQNVGKWLLLKIYFL
jgi:hypothetical protein